MRQTLVAMTAVAAAGLVQPALAQAQFDAEIAKCRAAFPMPAR